LAFGLVLGGCFGLGLEFGGFKFRYWLWRWAWCLGLLLGLELALRFGLGRAIGFGLRSRLVLNMGSVRGRWTAIAFRRHVLDVIRELLAPMALQDAWAKEGPWAKDLKASSVRPKA